MSTPTDSRGLIVVDELVEQVKEYISPEYRWPSGNNEHHLYYDEDVYRWLQEWSEGHVPSRRFRELPVNKIYTPVVFHNLLHEVTIPAPMPSPEVMRYYIGAWTAARNLFLSVQNAAHTERLSRHRQIAAEDQQLSARQEEVGREYMEGQFRRHFKGISRHLVELSLVPQEFWPFSPDVSALLAAGEIGDVILHHHQRQTRAVRVRPDGTVVV